MNTYYEHTWEGKKVLPQSWQSTWLTSFLTARLVSTGGKTAVNTDVSFVASIKNMYRIPVLSWKHLPPLNQTRDTTESLSSPPAFTCHTCCTLTRTWRDAFTGDSVPLRASSWSFPSNTTPARRASSCTDAAGGEHARLPLRTTRVHSDRHTAAPQRAETEREPRPDGIVRILRRVSCVQLDGLKWSRSAARAAWLVLALQLIVLQEAGWTTRRVWSYRQNSLFN